jgi:hypothetical protein
LEELGIKQGRMEEAFEEGQGTHRAVEPMMMMIGNNLIEAKVWLRTHTKSLYT